MSSAKHPSFVPRILASRNFKRALEWSFSAIKVIVASTPRDASVRLWTPMNAYERLWTPMNAYERLCTPMNVYERLWTPMNAPVRLRTPPYAYARLRTPPYASIHLRMPPYASVRLCSVRHCTSLRASLSLYIYSLYVFVRLYVQCTSRGAHSQLSGELRHFERSSSRPTAPTARLPMPPITAGRLKTNSTNWIACRTTPKGPAYEHAAHSRAKSSSTDGGERGRWPSAGVCQHQAALYRRLSVLGGPLPASVCIKQPSIGVCLYQAALYRRVY